MVMQRTHFYINCTFLHGVVHIAYGISQQRYNEWFSVASAPIALKSYRTPDFTARVSS
jgi:hypothetical protein